MITVLADQYLYKITSCLPKSIDLRLFNPAEGLPDHLHRAQGLLIRTVNSITRETLPEIPETLSFIGTASSGTDHVDRDYLRKNSITFASAAGCNARSVAEYIATGLLLWKTPEQLRHLSVGIIGAGNVGMQVQRLLERLHISTVCYDPPRARRSPAFSSATLDQVLQTDILTFHTPLTAAGNDPTFHWLDHKKLASHRFDLVVNTARGGVVDELALLEARKKGRVSHFMLDVWEGEPEVCPQAASKAYLKTPHIAGYSKQAKLNASKFVADALLDHFELDRSGRKVAHPVQQVADPVDQFGTLPEVLERLHPIRRYESELGRILAGERAARGQLFNKLRAEFPLRDEFSQIGLPESYFKRFPVLKKLGFRERKGETGD